MRWWMLTLLALSACAAETELAAPTVEDGDSLLVGAQSLGVVDFDEQGRSAPISLEASDAEAWALWTIADDETCFALEHSGFAARGAALDMLDGHMGQVRVQRLRCATGTPRRAPLERALTLHALPRDEVPSAGQLALRFVVSEHSALRGRPDEQRALLEGVQRELAETGIEPVLVDVVEIDGVDEEIRFSDLETEGLDALLELAGPAAEATIDVVFAGCLRRLDVLGTPSAVEGFTGRVGGGGGGSADAVFLPSLPCHALGSGPREASDQATAHILAHEIGHFLGLAHTEDAHNIMHRQPSLASAQGFSASQMARMRRHVFVR